MSYALPNIVITICILTSAGPFVHARQVHDDRPRELAGISSSESFRFKDDLELDTDTEIIPRLLYRLQKSSSTTLDRFSKFSKDKTWQDIIADTVDYRFWLFRLSATLIKVERIEIDAPNTPDSIKHFYRLQCSAIDRDGQTIGCIVLARTIPKSLRIDTTLNEPVQFQGLLYCRAVDDSIEQDESNQTTVVFIADRISWYPDTPTVASSNLVSLAAAGFDVGQLDQVRANNGRPLGRRDRDAFYQMIAAANNRQVKLKGPVRVSLELIISKSNDYIGSRVALLSHCRECTRIEIADPSIQQRYGLDHYYQLMLFPDFDQTIVLTEEKDGQTKQVTIDRYPVTVCCASLPPGLTAQDVHKSLVSIDGTFFRIWKYQSELNQQTNMTGTISPLIIADFPTIEHPPFWLNDLVTWLFWAGGLMVVSLYCYYRLFGGRRASQTESILESLPEKIDLSGME